MLNKIDQKMYKPVIMGFSAATTANQTQDNIMSKLDKRKKGLCNCDLKYYSTNSKL